METPSGTSVMVRQCPGHRRRRLLAGGFVAASVPELLASCSGQARRQPGLSESTTPVTLEWFGKLKGVAQGDVDAFVQQYKEARPTVTLNVTSVSNTAEGKTKLASYAAAGTSVDVVSTFAGIPDLRLLNGGSSLDDSIKRDTLDVSQFASNTMRNVAVKGKTLALPHAYAGNELDLVANSGIFRKAGVPLPSPDWKGSWTWPQFREALKLLTNFGVSPPVAGPARFGTIYNIPPMWGAKWATDDGKSVLTDKPEMVQACSEYLRHGAQGLQRAVQSQRPRSRWRAALLPGWQGRHARDLLRRAHDHGAVQGPQHRVGLPALPQGRRRGRGYRRAVIAIWSQSRSRAPEEAWRSLRWSIEEGRLANLEQRMPSQNTSIQPYVQTVYGATPEVRRDVFLKAPGYALPPDALWQSPASEQASGTITAALAEVQQGNTTVQAALTELKPQLQALLDQYRDL
jgi:ABC-type glycerol-3-phosphate transport system substrate-binding protein